MSSFKFCHSLSVEPFRFELFIPKLSSADETVSQLFAGGQRLHRRNKLVPQSSLLEKLTGALLPLEGQSASF